jgi:hypothetical protein
MIDKQKEMLRIQTDIYLRAFLFKQGLSMNAYCSLAIKLN